MNITRAEAQERSSHVQTHSYEVAMDLTGAADPAFVSTSTVRFTSDGAPTWIDLIADQVLSASLDGTPMDVGAFTDDRLPLAPAAGEHVLVVEARCRYSRTGEGLHRMVDPADGRVYLYSQFEPADARRAYACFEQPDLKATFRLTVQAPADWVVVSNAADPVITPAGGGMATWVFPATPPLSTYVTAVVAGEYHVDRGTVRSRKGELPASLVCRQSLKDYLDVEHLRTTTQRGFDVYEAAFSIDFPFDSYDQCFVPEYNAGAMENAGCVTVRDEYLWRSRVTAAEIDSRDNALLHELAHMWFGDLVTMRWWDDLWLNESFAEWASHYCQAQIAERFGGVNPWVGFAAGRKAWAFAQDQLPTTHPVAADMVDLDAVRLNFDGITYAKGASVLKQLVGLVGETDFLRGVHDYLTTHAYANASFADLLGALHEASGRDLTRFSADWLETAGVNTLRARLEVSDGLITAATIVQSTPSDHPTLRLHRLGIGCFDLTDGRLRRTAGFDIDVQGAETNLPQLVGRRRPDLLLLNDGDMTFAKVVFDQDSLRTALAHVGDVEDALARTLIFMVLQDTWRDGDPELPSGEFIRAVLASLPAESDMTALQRRLLAGRQAATEYSAPGVRPTNQAAWAGGLARLLEAAAPGGDAQVALADAMIEATGPADGDLIAGWLAGVGLPDGLPMEADRRWRVVRNLARLGRLGADEIAAELALDATQTGLEQAAGARAAVPSADAKAEAWGLATATPDVPNETHLQVCANFWQFGQEDLTRPYVPKYFDLAEAISARSGIWADRGDAVAETALNRLWPTPVADQALVDDTTAWLSARPGLAAPVVKIMRENLDRTRRLLTAQASSLAGQTSA